MAAGGRGQASRAVLLRYCATALLHGLAGLGIVAAIGVAGILSPCLLIAANWIVGDKVIVPSPVRGSHHNRVREMFSGSPARPVYS